MCIRGLLAYRHSRCRLVAHKLEGEACSWNRSPPDVDISGRWMRYYALLRVPRAEPTRNSDFDETKYDVVLLSLVIRRR